MRNDAQRDAEMHTETEIVLRKERRAGQSTELSRAEAVFISY